MDDLLQWAINAIIAILVLYAGRIWGRHDRKIEKDKNLIKEVTNIIPVDSDALYFLRTHDFGNAYNNVHTRSFWELNRLLNQPNGFFIDKKLDKARQDLVSAITEFQNFVSENIFASDRREGYWELANPHEIIRERHFYLRSQGKEISEEERNQITKHYEDSVNKLNSLANSICQKYDSLITNSHKIL